MTNNQSSLLTQIYQKLNTHVQFTNISISQFWTSQRLCQTFDVFNQMLINSQFFLNQQELQSISQGQGELLFVTLESLIQNIPYWKTQQQSISAYLSKKQQKTHKRKQYSQYLSSSKKSQSNQSMSSALHFSNKRYLNDHARKQLQDKIKLSQTLRTVKNQSDYELAVKIGQANDICTKLKNGTQYFLNTTQNNQLQILYSQKSNPSQIITLKKFQRHYQTLKLAILNQGQQIQGTLEDDLKKVLVQVMCLSSHIKQQIELLQKKGISY